MASPETNRAKINRIDNAILNLIIERAEVGNGHEPSSRRELLKKAVLNNVSPHKIHRIFGALDADTHSNQNGEVDPVKKV